MLGVARLAAVLLLGAAGLGTAAPATAQTVQSQVLAPGVAMLTGRGGNIGVAYGPDGVLLIDDQFADLTDEIRAAVAALDPGRVTFVVNTHWHPDHTGGNELWGRAGAVIVAHDAAGLRLRAGQFMPAFDRRVPAAPAKARPVVTFGDQLSFHWNGEEIGVFHVEPAHTDGDAVVHFRGSNVLHTGDVFFNGRYPFIDLASGGSVDGVLAAVDRLLPLLDDDTRIIPGHGPLAGRDDLVAYRAMLASVRERVSASIARGRSVDQVLAERPTADFDAQWGGAASAERFVRIVYASLGGG